MKQLGIGILIGCSLTIIVCKPSVLVPVNLQNNIYITAAHLEEPIGYKLLYKDEERDTSYYLKENPDLDTVEQRKVLIEGLPDCSIVSSEPGKFVIETSRPDLICNGLSGTIVKTTSGEEIGFVSKMIKGGLLECRTLQ